MNIINYKRSTWVLNLLIALVITLTVNFSYLLSMMVEQREASEQSATQEQEQRSKPEIDGVLHISRDGYGYILTSDSTAREKLYKDIIEADKAMASEQSQPARGNSRPNLPPAAGNQLIAQRQGGATQSMNFSASDFDSIYVNSRRINLYKLKNGDEIRCTVFPPRRGSNPIVDDITLQNGVEPTPITYDRPSREHETVIQMFYYLVLSFVLLSIMTIRPKRHSASTRLYLRRCFIALVVAFGCYFLAPYVSWYTGKMTMIFQSQQMMDWMVVLKCITVYMVAILYGRIYDLLTEQQRILVENEHLRSENLQTRYDMLMGQISPHFFFNSLNSLSMLVREKNDEKALEYIDQLSYTFRYIIQNGQNQKSTLEEEIEFAHAYAEIFKVRYADKLFFDFDIDPAYNKWILPPLTLQPLIGNAVKHNTITRKNPFHVSIRTEGSMLVVENRKTPKIENEPSTGIGLKNLSSRWQLITGEDIEIIDNETHFIVRMPLQRPMVSNNPK